MNSRTFLTLGAANAFLAVASGAFGAHALKDSLAPELLAVFRTAVEYHFWHALGLLAVGLVAARHPRARSVAAAGWCMAAGIVLFCGSLYLLAATGVRWLGAITPLGGVAFLAAWALLAYGAWNGTRTEREDT